jgi:hypothetical protein
MLAETVGGATATELPELGRELSPALSRKGYNSVLQGKAKATSIRSGSTHLTPKLHQGMMTLDS